MSDLNPRQNDAMSFIDAPLLVLAGAGSGKTRVITRKIAHLINKVGLEPRHITAVTFTNKAAREMKERVGSLLKGQGTKGLSISTFHTLGLNIMRREHKTLGFKPGFSIFDDQDTESLLKDLLHKGAGDDAAVSSYRWRISDWKNDMLTPEQALARAEDDLEQRAALVYANYQRSLKAYNAVDFDDLILLPVQLFQQSLEALERWQNRIRYLLVDEYQDTNLSQYELVKQLVGIRQALTVVGDDDQSIYAWRGARPENLARLKEDFPRLHIIKLEQNYRSTGRILKAANQLIDNNPHVLEKRLWSELGPGDPIRIMSCKNEQHEAEKVISEIIHHKFTKSTTHGDYAILYRGNHQAKLFETALRQNNIPYFLSGGTSFFSRSEVKDVMAYLRLLANPDDDAAFLRICNVPRREIGPTTLEKLGTYATERHIGMLAACSELGLEQTLSGRGLERVREFAHWVEHFHRRAEQDQPVETVRGMLKELNYEDWLYEKASSDKVAERRWENVLELVEWLDRLHKGDHVGESLAEIVTHLTLQDILERQDEESGKDEVHLMTLHASKGLEFPHVFLVGMEEELLPHKVSIEEENIEEERRLAYVGITRAQRTLTISYTQKRRKFGEITACEPSRFLEELPEEDLQWEGRNSDLSKEEKQERGNAHLANMRALLGS
ncbi:DNA helicase Rep [Solemya velesiana gill symbiont]|uniref:ATP-dependent DNA helicase Rep n=1 Tax=Solemya velesiana gill symbiont TaxID=1918948 RepID=A0A1T2KX42_9GAMM|nr:DNA helicase Rep [Solemya velesiana gill symbiont]OOZ37316.1 ATP-dependent DNA helicase Rep [Solemya velesiana gill symbiont]